MDALQRQKLKNKGCDQYTKIRINTGVDRGVPLTQIHKNNLKEK